MMKLDSCKKKQLYEYSFIKFMLEKYSEPITWVRRKNIEMVMTDGSEVNYFANDDIERRNEPYNTKKWKRPNAPLR